MRKHGIFEWAYSPPPSGLPHVLGPWEFQNVQDDELMLPRSQIEGSMSRDDTDDAGGVDSSEDSEVTGGIDSSGSSQFTQRKPRRVKRSALNRWAAMVGRRDL